MFLRVADLLFYYYVRHTDTNESCIILKHKIQQVGSIAIKIFQWMYQIQYHKYEDQDRPLIFEYIRDFQHSVRTVTLTDDDINDLRTKCPFLTHIDRESVACGTIGHIHRGFDRHQKPYILKLRHSCILEEMVFLQRFRFLLSPCLMDFLSSQIDFRIEAKNMDRMNLLYGDNPQSRIPIVHYSEEDVLVMDYIGSRHHPGQDDIFEVITLKLWMLDMTMFHGIMHGDIHNGNWGMGEGYLVIYDWGIIYTEQVLCDLVISFFDRDKNLLVKSLVLFFPRVDQDLLVDWIKAWEKDDYQLTKRVTRLLIRILRPCFNMTMKTLMFLNFINFFSILDQYSFVKETDLDEVRKFQLALLRSRDLLPNMQAHLEQKLFRRFVKG